MREPGQQLDEVGQVSVHDATLALGEGGDAREDARERRVRRLNVWKRGVTRDCRRDVLGAELVELVLQEFHLGGGNRPAGFVLDGAREGLIRREHRPGQRLGERVVRGLSPTLEARLEHLSELRGVAADKLGDAALERDVEDAEAGGQSPRRVLRAVLGGREELLDERKLDVDVRPRAKRLFQQRHGALV